MEPNPVHIDTLISMGFDELEVPKALKLAKNDVQAAVGYLTGETPGMNAKEVENPMSALTSYKTSSALNDGSVMNAKFAEENWDATDESAGCSQKDTQEEPSLEFPLTHMYELESRVSGEQWNVPYLRHESLGKCLQSARRLAEERLLDTDEGCQRFLNDSFLISFKKLLTSNEVRDKWNQETLVGIEGVLELLLELVATRLDYGPLSFPLANMLNTLAVAFDPHCNYHVKVRHNRPDETKQLQFESALGGADKLAAQECARSLSSYGCLQMLINYFAVEKGFERLFGFFVDGQLNAEEMYLLLRPLELCSEYLNPAVFAEEMQRCCQMASDYVKNISDADLKNTGISSFVVDLLGCVKRLWVVFGFDTDVRNSFDELRLGFIMRMLKSAPFGARMHALKEIEKLLNDISDAKKTEGSVTIAADTVSDWLADNNVLCVALEGNIDQSQYVERLKTLLSFLGTRLTKADIAMIWSLRKGRAAVAVDNVFSIVGLAARKFPRSELDHLLGLIENSWSHEDERGKERIVLLLGTIGKETQLPYTMEKVADFLWGLAHEKARVGVQLCNVILRQQLEVINNKTSPDDSPLRQRYIYECLQDIKDCSLPLLSALYHIEALISTMTKMKNSFNNLKTPHRRKKEILTQLCDEKQLVETLSQCLINIQKEALELVQSVPRSSTPILGVDRPSDQQQRLLIVSPAAQLNTPLSGAATSKCLQVDFPPSFLLSDGCPYGDYVDQILQFLTFALKEGELRIVYYRAEKLWESLVENEFATTYDKNACYKWFTKLALDDLADISVDNILKAKLLKMAPADVTREAFTCFRAYFEMVNIRHRKLNKLHSWSTPITWEVDSMDLEGLDFIWEVALTCPHGNIATEAIEMLIAISYTKLAAKLKKEPADLHRRFLSECYSRLDACRASVENSVRHIGESLSISTETCPTVDQVDIRRAIVRLLTIVAQYVQIVEDALPNLPRSSDSHGTLYYGPGVFSLDISANLDRKWESWQLKVHQNELLASVKRRLCILCGIEADRLQVEQNSTELTDGHKTLLQLGIIPPASDVEDMTATSLSVKRRLWASSTSIVTRATERRNVEAEQLPSALLVDLQTTTSQGGDKTDSIKSPLQKVDGVFSLLYRLASLDDENHETTVGEISERVSTLLNLIPQDPALVSALNRIHCENVSTPTVSDFTFVSKKKKADKKENGGKVSQSSQPPLKEEIEGIVTKLENDFFDPRQPFRLLYSLQVLSGRLLPTDFDATAMSQASLFRDHFVTEGGVEMLLRLTKTVDLHMPQRTTHRPAIVQMLLQLLGYLLVGTSPLHEILRSDRKAGDNLSRSPSPPNTATSSAAASSAAQTQPLVPPKKWRLAAEMSSEQFVIAYDFLQRIAWTAAAQLMHQTPIQLKSPVSVNSTHSWTYLTSQNHQKHSGDTGNNSDTTTYAPDTTSTVSVNPATVHEALVTGYTSLVSDSPSSVDQQAAIAKMALTLLVDCTLYRNVSDTVGGNGFTHLFRLPHFADFLLDTILLATDERVRCHAVQQFTRLLNDPAAEWASQLEFDLESNSFWGDDSGDSFRSRAGSDTLRRLTKRDEEVTTEKMKQLASTALTPLRIMLQILLRAPLPLWGLSSGGVGGGLRGRTAGVVGRRVMRQCAEYFELRSRLLAELTPEQALTVQPPISQMLDDEANWIINFSCSSDPRAAELDGRLLAGHLRLIGSLLRLCPSEQKPRIGKQLIKPILLELLFPASQLMTNRSSSETVTSARWGGKSARQIKAADARAKCSVGTADVRPAAYDMLLELCKDCAGNFLVVARTLNELHHEDAPTELKKQWDYQPLVDRKMSAGYVGLKNAGATCYMNSVLQQFFMEPGLVDSILAAEIEDDEESESNGNIQKRRTLYELQRLFGHLRESELQYYTPQRFWDAFRLWGQEVNPREQQDAFEFYTCLVDQIDSYLKNHDLEEIFCPKYRGVFSDQKICHGCPHRYERDEDFLALNLPLRAQGLEESLTQFVNGEILEGDNSYFCEKCGQKRTTLKRICIKSLPPVLVIQLKRFGYDFEEHRALKFNDHFRFPLSGLDMRPYTVEALANTATTVADLFEQSANSGTPLGSAATAGAAGTPVVASSSWRREPSFDRLLRSPFAGPDTTQTLKNDRYNLVGVVVHSGQATAGHYYSYVKERRHESLLNNQHGKWFKFNDQTVSEVRLTPEMMEHELFGGKYTVVNNDSKFSSYPEERERYWNAYLLVYERETAKSPQRKSTLTGGELAPGLPSPHIGGLSRGATGATTPLGALRGSKRSVSVSLAAPATANAATPILLSPGDGRQATANKGVSVPAKVSSQRSLRGDSICELQSLVETSEKQHRRILTQQLFPRPEPPGSIPQRLREEIREQNLKFASNTDVYDRSYFSFVAGLIDGACQLATMTEGDPGQTFAQHTVAFALNFLLNLCWHTKRVLRGEGAMWRQRIETLLIHSPLAAEFTCKLLGDDKGVKYLSDYLFDCDSVDVRSEFGKLVSAALKYCPPPNSTQDTTNPAVSVSVVRNLLRLVGAEASERHERASTLFRVIGNFAQLGTPACQQLIHADAFRILLGYLVTGVPPTTTTGCTEQTPTLTTERIASPRLKMPRTLVRRWTTVQSNELGDVYRTLANIICSCDLSPHTDTTLADSQDDLSIPSTGVLKCPEIVAEVIYGSMMRPFLRELLWALTNVQNTQFDLTRLAQHAAFRNPAFSQALMAEILRACHHFPANELRRIFDMLEKLLCSTGDTQLQLRRIGFVMDGVPEEVDGLLQLIKCVNDTESRRAYNCVKFLVKVAGKSPAVKEALLNDRLDQWQLAFDWLKTRMQFDAGIGETSSSPTTLTVTKTGAHFAAKGPGTLGNFPSSTKTEQSNEECLGRSFQRTVSAQYTLEQADALLHEIEVDTDEGLSLDEGVSAEALLEEDENRVLFEQEEELEPPSITVRQRPENDDDDDDNSPELFPVEIDCEQMLERGFGFDRVKR